MIWDVFPFFNELDLLELRLSELEDVVDKWVLVEFAETHTGIRKPFYFLDNRYRFAKWLPRIVHLALDEHLDDIPWEREVWQRNQLKRAFRPQDDDIISFSDCDEIPHPRVYRRFAGMGLPYACLNMMNCRFYLNTRYYDARWRFAKCLTGRFWNENVPSAVRYCLDGNATDFDWHVGDRLIMPGGWHFSYCFNMLRRKQKNKSIVHYPGKNLFRWLECTERSKLNIYAWMFFVQKLDIRMPKTVLNNVQKYKDLGLLYGV